MPSTGTASRWFESGKADQRPEADANDVDVHGVDPRLDDQALATRHDIHQGLSGRNNAARRMHLKTDDGAVQGSANLGPPQHVLGGVESLGKVEQHVLHVAQLLDDLVELVGPKLGDPQV